MNKILDFLADHPTWYSTLTLSAITKIPYNTTRQMLDELKSKGLVETKHDNCRRYYRKTML